MVNEKFREQVHVFFITLTPRDTRSIVCASSVSTLRHECMRLAEVYYEPYEFWTCNEIEEESRKCARAAPVLLRRADEPIFLIDLQSVET